MGERTIFSLMPYVMIGYLHFRRRLVRRANLVIQALTVLLFAYGLAFVWRTLYENEIVEPEVAIGHMVTYAILGAVLRMSWESGNVYDVNWRIRSGDVIGELTKPINWQLSTTAELLGDTAAQLLILTVVVLVPAGFLLGLQGPVSPAAGIVFLISMLLGLLIYSGITFLLVLLAFRVVHIHGYQLALFNISAYLGGSFVPLWLYPSWAEAALDYFPFALIYFAPLSIYIGRAESSEWASILLRQAIWVVVIVAAGVIAQRRVFARLTILGG